MVEAIVIGVMSLGMLCVCGLMWVMQTDIRKLETRVDFLTLLGAATALGGEATGDGERDFNVLIRRMDTVFGRQEDEPLLRQDKQRLS